MKLIAYVLDGIPPEIVPAPLERAWMDASDQRFAYRCLPLNIANCYGWELRCPAPFKAIWDGEASKDAIKVEAADAAHPPAISHFGGGVLTFQLHCLIRTEPGFDLMVTGPINRPKDAIAPLSGVIETDWAPYTFTMNWIFTQPEIEVEFEKGEPICQFFPVRRGEIEAIEPEFRSISSDPDLEARFKVWRDGRRSFNADLKVDGSQARAERWQKQYYRGSGPDLTAEGPPDHRTRLRLKKFRPIS